MFGKRASVDEQLARARTPDAKLKIGQEWANDWDMEFHFTLDALDKAAWSGDIRSVEVAVKELHGAMSKRLSALPFVIEQLASTKT